MAKEKVKRGKCGGETEEKARVEAKSDEEAREKARRGKCGRKTEEKARVEANRMRRRGRKPGEANAEGKGESRKKAVYILCPVPRYATFRCCDDPNHCTNFSDPSYLADLKKVKQILEKEIPNARVIDTLELIMGNSPKDLQAKEDTIRSCWSSDPVHANLHTYFKLAGNFIDYHNTRKPDQKPHSGS